MASIGQELLDVPFGEMISSLACSIVESQAKLDQGSIDLLKQMADPINGQVELPSIGGKPIVTSMIGAGFQPTFYQFSETVIEVKMAISMSQEKVENNPSTQTPAPNTSRIIKKPVLAVKATSVNAKYTNTFNFKQEGSSLIRTTLVPVPPNQFIQSIIDLKTEELQNAIKDQTK